MRRNRLIVVVLGCFLTLVHVLSMRQRVRAILGSHCTPGFCYSLFTLGGV